MAFVIAALAIGGLIGQGMIAVGATHASASYQEAISRAQSRLTALGAGGLGTGGLGTGGLDTGGLVAGEREGDDGGGFHWHTRIVPIASMRPARPVAVKNAPYAWGTTLFAVTVTVSWRAAGGRRSVELESRLLGPAPF